MGWWLRLKVLSDQKTIVHQQTYDIMQCLHTSYNKILEWQW
jgi:hypothetical protein